MIDIATLIAATEISLLDVSKQAFILATGLQNAAPGDESREPNKSVQYLFQVAERMDECWQKCKKLSGGSPLDQADKLYEYLQEAVAVDVALREKFAMKDKFRFIRDRLTVLHEHVAKEVAEFKKENVKKVETLAQDDMMVYVYLFNAQGLTIDTWRKMVNPSVFYEHSVNRPIYTVKEHVESFIGRKTNKLQHGYITIAIAKKDILPDEEDLKDIYDNRLIKVREGSLLHVRVISFTHNGIDYIVGENGSLAKKLI